jgi:ketosteroid isomerase-like protein
MRHVTILTGMALLAAGCQQAAAPGNDAAVAALVDRQAIDQLVAGDYPHALDHQDWKTYASYFTDDGELSLLDQKVKGTDGIIGMVSALPQDRKIIHVISNLSYTLQGDTAAGTAYWQDIGQAGAAPGVLAAGHYEDTLRKVNGRWKFASRAIVVEFMEAPGGGSASGSQ